MEKVGEKIYPSKTAEYRKQYRRRPYVQAKQKEYDKQYYFRNKEKKLKYNREHPEQIVRNHRRHYRANRRKPEFRLYHILCGRVLRETGQALDPFLLLGCTIPELIKYLESQFKPGMSWENHTVHGWHIDHIQPCASFDLTDPEQIKQCFHYSNLQPLWATENHAKRKKI